MDSCQQQSGNALHARAGATHSSPALEAFLEARRLVNERYIKYYAAALSGIILIFTVAHWGHLLVTKYRITSPVLKPFTSITRISRRYLLRKAPGFDSVGHGVLVSVYVAINLILSFVGVDFQTMTNAAARFGWMATGNMALVVFLALRNTPLAILTSYSYERLNVLHQISGYTTVLYMILHAAIYSAYFLTNHNAAVLRQDIVTAGIVLGFLMLASAVEAAVLRRFQYELFYVLHVVFFVAMVVTLGLHQPEIAKEKIAIAAMVMGAVWALDRLLRLGRLLCHASNNEATLHPLPHGATQILLRKPPAGAQPGSHCFVWLPRLRAFETHPFTIVSTSPTELVVNAHNGFTRDLHDFAQRHPGAAIRASVDGPYGTPPDLTLFDKVVLIAGGSGATFTFGLAANLLQNIEEGSNTEIDFIWTVRERRNISWFASHLDALRTHAHAHRIALRLHATRDRADRGGESSSSEEATPSISAPSSSSYSSSSSSSWPRDDDAGRKEGGVLSLSPSSSPTVVVKSSTGGGDPEKADAIDAVVVSSRHRPRHHHHHQNRGRWEDVPCAAGRPDVAARIRAAVTSVPPGGRVLVAGCGPASLMKEVRNTAADCIAADGPSVALHLEQFGW